MKVLQINTVVNYGSTGKIVENIGTTIQDLDGQSYIAYGRNERNSKSKTIFIGSRLSRLFHVCITRLFDLHGYGSKSATRSLVKSIEAIDPDVIHLHNLHGYYLNISILFDFLKRLNKPIVWTMHDCWTFTGHCAYYSAANCSKWQNECNNCPISFSYPKSFYDGSKRNFNQKKQIFQGVERLYIVTPSEWLKKEIAKSFLRDYPTKVINNGIDLQKFTRHSVSKLRNKLGIGVGIKIILGVANIWETRKGLHDFFELSKHLDPDYRIVLIGLTKAQINGLPTNVIGIQRTESVEELAAYYSMAECFFNPTYEDNFPTTNIEAIACGAPIITYDTGGSPEVADFEGGFIVNAGDFQSVINILKKIRSSNHLSDICRKRAESLYDEKEKFKEYYNFYLNILSQSPEIDRASK